MIDVYILDDNFFEIEVIDHYSSLIWTERFDSLGDFELVFKGETKASPLLTIGRILSIKQSNRMMIIEKIHEKPTGNGSYEIVYSGESFEKVVNNRISRLPRTRSVKSWLFDGVNKSSINGLYSPDDTIPNMKLGVNEVYPASTIPPVVETPPFIKDGWVDMAWAHEEANRLSPLGFRVVRRPGTREIFYDNYTGNDRTGPGKFEILDTNLSWPNPNMFETLGSVDVWKNLAANPGFTENCRNFLYYGYPVEYSYNGPISGSIVNASHSKSGKGFKLTGNGRSTGDSYETYAMASGPREALSELYGRTFTIGVTIKVLTTLTGRLSEEDPPLSLSIRVGTAAEPGSTPLFSLSAPNVPGTYNLSGTFTFPQSSSGFVGHQYRLVLGTSIKDEAAVFSDLWMVEHTSNPIGYFDGDYSPDPDLIPLWVGEPYKSESVLRGDLLYGVRPEDCVNCVLIQSNQYGSKEFSARMIRNVSGTDPHYVKLDMSRPGKKLYYKSIQLDTLTGVLPGFGKVELFDGETAIASTSDKANNLTEVDQSVTVPTGYTFDSVILRGNYTELGGSLWFDRIIAVPDANWSQDETVLQGVIFSEDMDTFNVSEVYESAFNYRNVAYVTRGDLLIEVDEGYSEPGALRRIIHVDASDLEDSPTISSEMARLGREALADNRKQTLIDGSVPEYSRYVYDVDYFLGDIVLIKDRNNRRIAARVAEQIYTCDAEGVKSYPTLREETSVQIGVWFSTEYNVYWPSIETEWIDQP